MSNKIVFVYRVLSENVFAYTKSHMAHHHQVSKDYIAMALSSLRVLSTTHLMSTITISYINTQRTLDMRQNSVKCDRRKISLENHCRIIEKNNQRNENIKLQSYATLSPHFECNVLELRYIFGSNMPLWCSIFSFFASRRKNISYTSHTER